MRCAVLVPTYSGHLQFLPRLLESIASQSRMPDMVVIRASSITTPDHHAVLDQILSSQHPYPVEILRTSAAQTAAENRNALLEHCRGLADPPELLSFIDSDDLMLPRRIEILCDVMETTRVDAIVHGFVTSKEPIPTQEFLNSPPRIHIDTQELYYEPVRSCITGKCEPFHRVCFMDGDGVERRSSYGHISLRVSTTHGFSFSDHIARVEDALFVSELVRANKSFAFISEPPLSIYTLH